MDLTTLTINAKDDLGDKLHNLKLKANTVSLHEYYEALALNSVCRVMKYELPIEYSVSLLEYGLNEQEMFEEVQDGLFIYNSEYSTPVSAIINRFHEILKYDHTFNKKILADKYLKNNALDLNFTENNSIYREFYADKIGNEVSTREINIDFYATVIKQSTAIIEHKNKMICLYNNKLVDFKFIEKENKLTIKEYSFGDTYKIMNEELIVDEDIINIMEMLEI